MKERIVFILIFFLFFTLQIKSAFGIDVNMCHCGFDTNEGECFECGTYVEGSESSESSEGTEIPGALPPQAMGEATNQSRIFSSTLFTLVFQFFGMVVLIFFLIVLLQELFKVR